MNGRSIHWPLWSGLALSVVAFLSYFFFFSRFPVTRDVPWVNALLFVVAIVLLAIAVRRAFAGGRRKVLATVAGLAGVAVALFFGFAVLVGGRDIPAAPGAPKVGQRAPDFALRDTEGRTIALSQLTAGQKGVLLVFYRGYW
jgi:hypothetical protein